MLPAVWKKNDARARVLIITLSVVVFGAVVALGKVKLNVHLGFDEHIFAKINAAINSTVSVLLLFGLIAVKSKNIFCIKRS
jgi:putative membrane protein